MVAGQTAALALKKIKRSAVRKGMVLVDERLRPVASWEFDADIAILTHSTTIQPRYQVQGASVPCPLVFPAGFRLWLKLRDVHVVRIASIVEILLLCCTVPPPDSSKKPSLQPAS